MAWLAVGKTAFGLIAGAGGAFLKGKAGDIAGQKLENAANIPGLDIAGLSAEALKNQQALLPGANALTRDEALARQQTLNDLIESSLPGYSKLLGSATSTAQSFFDDPLNKRGLDALQYNAAVNSIGRGFGGSGMHQAYLGRSILDNGDQRKAMGLSWLSQLRGLAPVATPQSAFNFTGPNANQFLAIRGGERAQRQQLYAQTAGIPGMTSAFGDYLSSVGGAATGAGMKGFGALGGGSSVASNGGAADTTGSMPGGLGGSIGFW